jgi:hypothetical protein
MIREFVARMICARAPHRYAAVRHYTHRHWSWQQRHDLLERITAAAAVVAGTCAIAVAAASHDTPRGAVRICAHTLG